MADEARDVGRTRRGVDGIARNKRALTGVAGGTLLVVVALVLWPVSESTHLGIDPVTLFVAKQVAIFALAVCLGRIWSHVRRLSADEAGRAAASD